jgi:hypothetical protein
MRTRSQNAGALASTMTPPPRQQCLWQALGRRRVLTFTQLQRRVRSTHHTLRPAGAHLSALARVTAAPQAGPTTYTLDNTATEVHTATKVCCALNNTYTEVHNSSVLTQGQRRRACSLEGVGEVGHALGRVVAAPQAELTAYFEICPRQYTTCAAEFLWDVQLGGTRVPTWAF